MHAGFVCTMPCQHKADCVATLSLQTVTLFPACAEPLCAVLVELTPHTTCLVDPIIQNNPPKHIPLTRELSLVWLKQSQDKGASGTHDPTALSDTM